MGEMIFDLLERFMYGIVGILIAVSLITGGCYTIHSMITPYFKDRCIDKADAYNTEYKFYDFNGCYLKLEDKFVPERMYENLVFGDCAK